MRVVRFVALASTVAALAFASNAAAENYGGVSPAEKQRVIHLIYKYFGTGWKGQTMVRCAARESGFNERAFNPTDSHAGSVGIFQLNGVHNPGYGYVTAAWKAKMMNAEENIKAAARLARGGLGPWGGGC